MTPLVDDLLEDVLLRLPPHEPASLVRAAVVCRRWRRLVSSPVFRRRFREFHRSPPVCNCVDTQVPRFVPTAALCSPEFVRGHWWRALDARHGRVLFHGKGGSDLMVWDPITDEERVLPFPPQYTCTLLGWTATVLCAGAAAGASACDHLDCCRGPFTVVFVGSVFKFPHAGETFVTTYESKTAAWTEPIYTDQPGDRVFSKASTLVGNALYFVGIFGGRVLKYNLELQETSWIRLPSSFRGRRIELIITENGELGLATVQYYKLCIWNGELGLTTLHDDYKLCIWSRKQDACKVGDEWKKPSRAIDLKTLLPADAALSKLDVVGSAEGVGIIFLRAGDVVYTIDLKTYEVKKVYQGKINVIIPYMSFYTPAFETVCTGGSSVGSSRAYES